MDFLRTAYQRLVPHRARGTLWRWRASLREFAAMCVDPLHWRELCRQRSIRAGKYVRKVRLLHANLFVDVRDVGVGAAIYVRRSYQPAETLLLRRLLRSGMTVVDIGANLGFFTTLAATLVGASGKVIAVEPEPYNFRLLARNVEYNGLENCRLFNCALGSEAGTSRLFLSPDSNLGDHRLYGHNETDRESVEVSLRTGDSLLAEQNIQHVDFIKMDVQGFELYVLRGLRRTLSQAGPLMLAMEVWPFGMARAGSCLEQLLAFLVEYDLRAYRFDRAGIPEETSFAEIREQMDRAVRIREDAFEDFLFCKGIRPIS